MSINTRVNVPWRRLQMYTFIKTVSMLPGETTTARTNTVSDRKTAQRRFTGHMAISNAVLMPANVNFIVKC